MDLAVSEMQLDNQRKFVGIMRDITASKQAEDALRESEATNRALLHAIPDLMFRVNREGIFLDFIPAKDAGEQLLVSPNEFLGKKVHDILPAEVAHQTMDCMERA
jgi:PAS domain-containing protein